MDVLAVHLRHDEFVQRKTVLFIKFLRIKADKRSVLYLNSTNTIAEER